MVEKGKFIHEQVTSSPIDIDLTPVAEMTEKLRLTHGLGAIVLSLAFFYGACWWANTKDGSMFTHDPSTPFN
jgi:hypothetical protein